MVVCHICMEVKFHQTKKDFWKDCFTDPCWLDDCMGFEYILRATPAVESATLRLKLFKFL